MISNPRLALPWQHVSHIISATLVILVNTPETINTCVETQSLKALQMSLVPTVAAELFRLGYYIR